MKILCFLSCLLLAASMNAQDFITLKSGEDLKTKVVEVLDTEVKYKSWENQTGPTRTLAKAEIFQIVYENGSKELFGNLEQPKKSSADLKIPTPKNQKMAFGFNAVYQIPVFDFREEQQIGDKLSGARSGFGGELRFRVRNLPNNFSAGFGLGFQSTPYDLSVSDGVLVYVFSGKYNQILFDVASGMEIPLDSEGKNRFVLEGMFGLNFLKITGDLADDLKYSGLSTKAFGLNYGADLGFLVDNHFTIGTRLHASSLLETEDGFKIPAASFQLYAGYEF